MAASALIDAGPLVAVVNRRDQWHQWAKREFDRATEPFLTCEAALSEAFHLLETYASGGQRILDMLDRQVVICDFSFAQNQKQVAALIRKYADIPMALADACLVRMAELRPGARIFTTDDDFRLYRKSDRTVLALVAPPQMR
jgi:predicted nucleic acid-binding protein